MPNNPLPITITPSQNGFITTSGQAAPLLFSTFDDLANYLLLQYGVGNTSPLLQRTLEMENDRLKQAGKLEFLTEKVGNLIMQNGRLKDALDYAERELKKHDKGAQPKAEKVKVDTTASTLSRKTGLRNARPAQIAKKESA
jgi:hypothetical protein